MFLKLCQKLRLIMLFKFDNIKHFHPAVFYLEGNKAVIQGVFSRLYCCYGNLLCHENEKVFIND